MIKGSNTVGIIADDLTGANDTALQFKLNGAETNIMLDKIADLQSTGVNGAWAISTESRNVSPKEAFENVKEATEFFLHNLNPDFFYKKIDSTVRGNIAVEIMSILEVLGWDAALIMPAFPIEGRITVGGYQLLKGVPIERTEMARDPHSPITESHLPTLLKSQLGMNLENLVGTIDLKTVLDGAGPILLKLNDLIMDGKKIIVADSVSTTDLEQIVLAMQRSNYEILPVGNAAAAKVLSNIWFPKEEMDSPQKICLPKLPKFIVSGSATQITANQIVAFEQGGKYFDKRLIIELDLNTVLKGVSDELVNKVIINLSAGNLVLVHTSNLLKNFDGFDDDTADADLTKAGLAGKVTDFLAELTKRVIREENAILITLGGETSYKCCNAINANHLKLLDEVLPAIALSKNINSDRFIVTKSGNLGGLNTLNDILEYFEIHEG